MYSITYITLAIWFLESSCGKNLVHKDIDTIGPLGMKSIRVKEVNRILGYEKYKLRDRKDKFKCFDMARIYFQYWWKDKLDLEQAFLLWNMGEEGSKHPTREQNAYALHGHGVYLQLMKGTNLWNLK